MVQKESPIPSSSDKSHVIRTSAQWDSSGDQYRVIPRGVLCIEEVDLIVENLEFMSIKSTEEYESRNQLPKTGNKLGDVRFVKNPNSQYDDPLLYVWNGSKWVFSGGSIVDVDLSEYCKKSEILPRLQQLEALSHTHRNKAILDSTSAIYTTGKDEKLASLKNYDVFVPATEEEDGVDGLVPAPSVSETDKFLRGDGTWVDVEGGTYVLPPATDTTLGGIIVGDGLEITEEGVLSGNEYHAGTAISMSGDDDTIDVNIGQGLSVDNDNNIVNDGVLDVSEKQSAPGVFTVSKRNGDTDIDLFDSLGKITINCNMNPD